MKDGQRDCPNPPSYAVSIMHGSGEYLIGVVCEEHRKKMERLVDAKQKKGDLPGGRLKFVALKSVGTDCIKDYMMDDDDATP